MKALVYTQPNALALHDEAEPTPRSGEVIVRVDAVGICGSDMHAYHGHDSRRPPPSSSTYGAAGSIVAGPISGTRVAVNPLVTCGICDWCLPAVLTCVHHANSFPCRRVQVHSPSSYACLNET